MTDCDGGVVMATIFYDKDASLEPLRGKTVAVIGYGSQGHAHAQNLRDSGVSVVVGLYRGSASWAKAEADGFRVATVGEAAQQADLVVMLAPDHVQRQIYENEIGPTLRSGNTLLFAHGFNIHFGQIVPAPTVDVVMIAPKAPGHRMRELFVEGVGVPGLLSVHQDVTGRAKETALAYARAVGCTKAGVIETTFKEETETDLFGEQTVLCGGISSLIKTGFDILVEAGYQPEIAYFECLHEMKLIVDLMYEGGLSYMRYSVSDTAEYGDYSRGHRVISDRVRAEMKRILREVQDGTFAREWVSENQAGRPNFKEQRKQEQAHRIEEVGHRLGAMTPCPSRKETKQPGRGRGGPAGGTGARAHVYRHVAHPHGPQAADVPRRGAGDGAAGGGVRPDPGRRSRVQRRRRHPVGRRLPVPRVRGGHPRGCYHHQHPRYRWLRAAGGVWRAGAVIARACAGHGPHYRQRPLPQRPWSRHRQHPGGCSGRRQAGGGHNQRHRGAGGQRRAGGRDYDRGHAARGDGGRHGRGHNTDLPHQPVAVRRHGSRCPAEQGHRGGERLRPRGRHSPAWGADGPADVRDHDARVDRPSH